MLDLVHAERPEDLVDELVAHLRARAHDLGANAALQPAPVVVQSLSLESWVTQRVADRLGVAANLRFLLPNRFLHEVAGRVLGTGHDLRSPLEPPASTWRILALLGDPGLRACSAQLEGYLHDADLRRRFRLARRVADLFDQYLLYRPDWIEAWEAGRTVGLGPSEEWQSALWRQIVQGLPGDERTRSSRLRPLIEAVRRPDAAHAVPRHLAFFGISSLPPLYLELIAALARHGSVSMLLLNPCTQHDWGRIELPRTVDQLAELTEEDMYFTGGNPLLASMARPVRDFVDLVIDSAGDLLRDPRWLAASDTETPEPTLLRCIQQDVRTLTWRRAEDAIAIPASDRSLQVHVCHGPMREVEVLHDQLLRLFDADSPVPGLQPHEVAVLVPDIDAYAPYIDAVFGAGLSTAPGQAPRRIPYTLADRTVAGEHALLRTFVGLLALPESRFRVDEVLDLLAQPAVRVRAGLDDAQLAQLKQWIDEAGIRWGRDGAHREALSLPALDEHTWMRGLQRLLLGALLPPELAGGDELPLFRGRLPHDGLDGGDARTLGAFAAWFERLCAFADGLRAPRTAARWRADLSRWFLELCDVDTDRDSAQVLKDALAELERTAAAAGFDEPLDAPTVRAWLDAETAATGGRGGNFLAGSVTFGRLVPMRSIPFRMLCVLGLDDASFPRSTPASGFDLMARHPRRGDRSRRSDDRYLFLELLLAARECLYLSYVGRDARDNSVRPPSVLLAELIDVVTEGFVPEPKAGERAEQRAAMRKQLITEHPLQPFSERYFDQAAHEREARVFSYAVDWGEAARITGQAGATSVPVLVPPGTTLPDPEPELLQITIDDLVRFLSNPARFFCERRLGVRLPRNEAAADTDEPFEIDFDLQFPIRDAIVDALDRGRSPDDVRTVLREQGLLPHGGPGDAAFDERWAAFKTQRRERDERGAVVDTLRDVRHAAHGVTLCDRLPELREGGLVLMCGGRNPFTPDRLRLWVDHLLLSLARPPGVAAWSVALGLDESLVFESPVANPAAQLDALLQAYAEGLARPIPFVAKCAQKYAEKRAKLENDRLQGKDVEADPFDVARAAARAAWDPEHGSSHPPAADPYWKLVARGRDVHELLGAEFERWAEAIAVPLEFANQKLVLQPGGAR